MAADILRSPFFKAFGLAFGFGIVGDLFEGADCEHCRQPVNAPQSEVCFVFQKQVEFSWVLRDLFDSNGVCRLDFLVWSIKFDHKGSHWVLILFQVFSHFIHHFAFFSVVESCNVIFSSDLFYLGIQDDGRLNAGIVLGNALEAGEVGPNFLEGCFEFEGVAEFDHVIYIK